jgi:autotransporter-associated beta strand protein
MKAHKVSTHSLYVSLVATLAVVAVALAPQPAEATPYYYDNDSSNPGFGAAGGIWAAPTAGPIPGWTTDATGSSVPGSITITTSDPINFGNGATGLGAGTITLSGALSCSNITFASGSGTIVLSGGTSLTLPATAIITVDNSSDTIATPLAGAATGLTKAGTGTLILSGANTISGAVTVSGGELQLNNGSFNLGAKAVNVATAAGQQAVFNILNGSLTNSTSDSIGYGTNAVAVIKMSGGNYVKTAGNLNLAGGAAGRVNYSAFLMSGGFASIGGEFDMARDSVGAATYVGLSGGLLACYSYGTVGREGLGVLDISGGTLLRPSTAANKFYMNRSAGSFSQLTIRGAGTMDFEDNPGFPFANSASNAGSGVANLLAGGTFISRVGISWNGSGMTFGYFNFNGGTLKASGSSATFWTNGWTACYVYSGGAVIDSQGNNITIGQPLLVPAGNGVISITGGSGSGYLAPPVVSLTGDGTGATAIAQIDSSGNVTNVLVTNPGVSYSSAPTVALIGGGGTASGWTAAIGANVATGGLTKLGSGTLTLSGANTYQGPTQLGAGMLALAAANYPTASALTISNSSALSLDVSGGSSTLATPALTLGSNSSLNFSYGSVGANPSQPAISDVTINAGTTLNARGTNITINLSGSGFTAGQFPLIKYSGSIGGNGFAAFKIGTRPAGVSVAQLVNNTANGSIDLVIPLVNSLTWNGTNSNWDINSSYNWKDSAASPVTYKEYGTTNIYGDIVTFDDSLSNPSMTNINLTTALRPTTINLAAFGTPYVFSGTGKLSGGSYVNVSGSAAVKLSNTNDYSGGSTLAAGTVLLGNNSALGSGPITLAGSVLSSDSTTPRALTNPVNVIADSIFGVDATSGTMTLSGPVSLGGGAPALTLNNDLVLVGAASNGGITKFGAGTLVVDNPATALSGVTTVFAGKVALNKGTFTGAFNIAPTLSQTGVVEIVSANITNTPQNNVAAGADAVGVIRQSGGSFVESGILAMGNAASGSAAYLMSGGYAYFGNDVRLDYNGAVGLISQSGGTMVSANYFSLARDSGLGVYDLSGGLHYRPADAVNRFYMTRTAGSTAQLTIRGTGILDIEDNLGLSFANNYTYDTYGCVNLLTGGTIISRVGFYWGNTGAGTIGYVNFNGGTLRASGDSTNYFSGWTAAYVYGGGAVIDSQGRSITIGQALLAPTGSGVISITGGTGSGYLSPPVVTLSGDGTGAMAIAQIDSSGNVTNILISNPGVNYTSASVTLAGGGGTSSGWTVNLGANATTGGLVKLGSGTLQLNGVNTYVGTTLVSQGTLGGTGTFAGPVNVASGANLAPGNSIGTLTINHNLTLSNGCSAVFEVNKDDLSNDFIAGLNNITYAGSLIVTNIGTNAFTGGERFQLFSASGTRSGNFTNITIQPATGASGTFDPATGTLTVNVSPIPTTPTNITVSFSGGNINLGWPASYLGWIAQSNAVTLADSNSWFDIPGSSGVTSLVITPSTSQKSVFYRLRLP